MKQELDPACLARAQRGDARAFRALYEHHCQLVHRFLVRMLGSEAAAEDALQETFLRVLRGLRGFDPAGPARLSTWVLTIARHTALNQDQSGQRSRRREQQVAALSQTTVTPPAPDLRDALTQAVAALPPGQRSVFVLRECHALAYEEIARVEETDVGTVKSRLFRARLALQERLREHLNQPAGGKSDDDGRGRERRAKS